MLSTPQYFDVLVIGGGAAGLMPAVEAGKRGRKVCLIEHTDTIGEKIRISGGGRCNFTNIHATSVNYISQNPHFIKSALAVYGPQDFIKLLDSYQITYHEKTLGQLFCDGSAKQIIHMFLDLCAKNEVIVKTSCSVIEVDQREHLFQCHTNQGLFSSQSLIIATGGLSIPQIGASDFGYKIARQFGHKIINTQPALVPLLVPEKILETFKALSGVSNPSVVSYKKTHFPENILFTHRGLSGPAILQISSYLENFVDTKITIDLLPQLNLLESLKSANNSKQTPANYLKAYLTNRLVDGLFSDPDFHKRIADLSMDSLKRLARAVHNFEVPIAGSEGYKKAEVTVGGVDTQGLSSKTMESKKVSGLFFIGEVVDVTGWLGGYNFQWAWASGFAAGQYC